MKKKKQSKGSLRSKIDARKSKKTAPQSSEPSKPLKTTPESITSNPVTTSESPSNIQASGTNDFSKTIQESKTAIREAAQKNLNGKRGRKAYPRDEAGNIIRPTQTMGNVAHSPSVGGPDLTEILVTPLKLLSQIPARKHKMPDLALTGEEALAIANSLNKVLDAYIPDLSRMSPKASALLMAGVTIGSVGVTKYQIYLENKNERQVIEEVIEELPRPTHQDIVDRELSDEEKAMAREKAKASFMTQKGTEIFS